MAIRLVHLYSKEMNLYADSGNVRCLEYRMKQRGFDVCTSSCNVGDKLPCFDILVIGGGQDNEMEILKNDAKRKSKQIADAIESGAVILAICGGYQLLGKYYQCKDNKLSMMGILPFYTVSSNKRMVGNIVFSTSFGKIVGFENHSGKTYLESSLSPLGKVITGYGNNGEDSREGLRYKNLFCTYAHGPVLPKNPSFADEIIKLATNKTSLEPIDDAIENKTHIQLIKRFT